MIRNAGAVVRCAIELHIPLARSLKDKRSQVKPFIEQLKRRYNVSVSEVDHQDVWHSTVIAFVVVSETNYHAEQMARSILNWIEHNTGDMLVTDEVVERLT